MRIYFFVVRSYKKTAKTEQTHKHKQNHLKEIPTLSKTVKSITF